MCKLSLVIFWLTHIFLFYSFFLKWKRNAKRNKWTKQIAKNKISNDQPHSKSPYKKRITSSNTVAMFQDVARIVIPIEKRIANLESDLCILSTNNLNGMKLMKTVTCNIGMMLLLSQKNYLKLNSI